MGYIKNLINKIHFKVWHWFYFRSPVFISLNPLKCFSDWWKVRKVFRRPVLRFFFKPQHYLGDDYFFVNAESYNYLKIVSESCGWKSKYGTVRFESVPYFAIYWKYKLLLVIGLECPFYEYSNIEDKMTFRNDNLLYWEGVLGYLYDYNKNIIETFKNNIWNGNVSNECNKYTLINGLKTKYVDQIINYYNEIRFK